MSDVHKFLLRVPEDLYSRLDQESKGKDLSLNHVILTILSERYNVPLMIKPRARKKRRFISPDPDWKKMVEEHGSEQEAVKKLLNKD